MSNSTEGECIVAAVARRCLALGHFDQYSIISEIMGQITPSHAKFWAEQGQAIFDGRDARNRCECGKLATSFSIGGADKATIGRCGDCSADHMFGLLAAEPREPENLKDPWEVFGEWLTEWRVAHPEDEREDIDLIDEYAKGGDNA